MKAIKGIQQYLVEGRQAEQSGRLAEAATSYERVAARDPANEEAVERLLILYRKLKNFKKELAVIDQAVAAYREKNKASEENWLRAHPTAAGAGKAVLRSLGGTAASGFGTDPTVGRLLKRREWVKRKIDGKPTGSGGRRKAGRSVNGKAEKSLRQVAAKGVGEERRQEKIRVKREAAKKREEEREAKREEAKQRKQQAKEEREAAAAQRESDAYFVITLRYLAPLERIDEEMHYHMAFLDKYYKSGNILLSGRQVPRTGGIIIAKTGNRDAAERMMKQDPFVKKKLATFDIVQFSPSRV